MPAWQKALVAAAFAAAGVAAGVFLHYYTVFSAMIDARLGGEVFDHASVILSAPEELYPGDAWTPQALITRLRRAEYREGSAASGVGEYSLRDARLEIYPGPDSYFHDGPITEEPAALQFDNGKLASITRLSDGQPLDHYWIEPQVITTLFDQSRTKRRLVHYEDLPKTLVDAVLAAEDHRFFSHHGVNFYRLIGAAITDLRGDRGLQGGSTLTMQLARSFFLTPQRTPRRKLEEIFLAFLLEQRLSKEEIFALYANQVYLGQHDTFAIHGFGEAADAYFGKDVRSITLPEAALLAALIRGPNLYSPYKHPARAVERRNLVLRRMAETGFITREQERQAAQAPLTLAHREGGGSDAPYFVDLVKDELLSKFSERDLLSQSYRIYTTLDLDLQAAATESVRTGMKEVDEVLAKRRGRRKEAAPPDPNQPQVALIALDPHTGAVRALVGGRDYGESQLNHVLARRQPGSIFKPFVYAAALDTAVNPLSPGAPPLTTATVLSDEPTTFEYEGKTYEPRNYKQEYHGDVTLRQALAYSLNNATVRLAEMVGYERIRQLAIRAGINHDLLATPALALGAYVATPMEMAGAYTVFANKGKYESPWLIQAVKDSTGRVLYQSPVTERQVLDPRVDYLMVNLMQSVIDHGTAFGVRARGFSAPAAGKTGTSHDGWFAGFTSNLLAVVWIGYDDDRELGLSGSASALPIWTDFMKRAVSLPPYHRTQDFAEPPGIVTVPVTFANVSLSWDKMTTGQEVFIAGTEPSPEGLGERLAGVLRKILPLGEANPEVHAAGPPTTPSPASSLPGSPNAAGTSSPASESPDPAPPKKRGVIKKFLSIFKKGSSKDASPPKD